MNEVSRKRTLVRCTCGSVELEVSGAPITGAACYCDDCQAGSRQIAALPNAGPVQGPDGGTAYLLYRKDRVNFSKGKELLRDYRIREKSVTNRVVARCCNSAMFLNFASGHWLSLYQERFQGTVPPLQMRIYTKFKPEHGSIPDDVPSYPTFPVRFVAKLIAARVAMWFQR